jgi:hypothetical protein
VGISPPVVTKMLNPSIPHVGLGSVSKDSFEPLSSLSPLASFSCNVSSNYMLKYEYLLQSKVNKGLSKDFLGGLVMEKRLGSQVGRKSHLLLAKIQTMKNIKKKTCYYC